MQERDALGPSAPHGVMQNMASVRLLQICAAERWRATFPCSTLGPKMLNERRMRRLETHGGHGQRFWESEHCIRAMQSLRLGHNTERPRIPDPVKLIQEDARTSW